MKIDNKRPINITLSPDVLDKLAQMERNARKIYGKTASRSAIIEDLLRKAGDRKSQILSRIKQIQIEMVDLQGELEAIESRADVDHW
jgi:hypothetical protein